MQQLIKCFFPTSPSGHDTKCSTPLSSFLFYHIFIPLPVTTTTGLYHVSSCIIPTPYFNLYVSSTHSSYRSFCLSLCPPSFNPFSILCLSSFSLLSSLQGIGRLILKEEMKARSGCHDNDQWGSRRSSRCNSKEALNNLGYGSLNGCKCVCVRERATLKQAHISSDVILLRFCRQRISH